MVGHRNKRDENTRTLSPLHKEVWWHALHNQSDLLTSHSTEHCTAQACKVTLVTLRVVQSTVQAQPLLTPTQSSNAKANTVLLWHCSR